MPLYEYECTACHRRTEKIQKFSDPELTVCPHCGGPLERTITAAAFSFAGGGWYKDGYGSAKPATHSSDSSSPDSASTNSSSADSSAAVATPATSAPTTPSTASATPSPSTPAPAATAKP